MDFLANNYMDQTEKINTLQSQFSSVLDDFKKYYVYYHKNPEVSEFQNYYENSKSQLASLTQDMGNVKNGIVAFLERLEQETAATASQLSQEKQTYAKLTKRKEDVVGTENGSEILVEDAKHRYNRQYYDNVEMVVGIALLICLLGHLMEIGVRNTVLAMAGVAGGIGLITFFNLSNIAILLLAIVGMVIAYVIHQRQSCPAVY